MAASMKMMSPLAIALVVGTLFLAGTGRAEGQDLSGINEFCRTADNKQLCDMMVNGAKDMKSATKNAIGHALGLAERINSMTGPIVSAVQSLPKVTKDSIISTCEEAYTSCLDDLHEALMALETNDDGSLLAHVSAAYKSDCEDEMQNFGATFPLSKVLEHYKREVSAVLAVITQR